MRFLPRLATFITLLFVAGFFVPAQAHQVACIPDPEQAEKALTENLNMEKVGRGIGTLGAYTYTFWVSPSGTWALLSRDPRGIQCFIGLGENWEVESLPDPSPAPSGDAT